MKSFLKAPPHGGASDVKTFLHVGCGPARQPQTPFARYATTWRETTMDVDAAMAPDILGSMTDMPSVETGTFDAVYSSHSIEHLYPHQVPVALAEFKRVLKPTGFALIACPDIQSVCAAVAAGNLTEPLYISMAGPISAIDVLYGYRPAIAAGNTFMAHRTGFTQASMEAELTSAGFGSIAGARYPAPQFELWTLAFVSRQTEDTVTATARLFFPG